MVKLRTLIVNPPHPSVGSGISDDHFPPLDLLSIGGPLIDGGQDVRLLDAEFGPVPIAVVVQFSRGCPHPCNYCGQRGFWTKWRHRDPEMLTAEIARLHRGHGVEVFNFLTKTQALQSRCGNVFWRPSPKKALRSA